MRSYTLKTGSLGSVVGNEFWIGIDAHKENLSFTVLNAEREVVERVTLQNKRAAVTAFLGKYSGKKVHAVYEAGPTGYQLLRWLREQGCDAFMTPPALVPTAAGDRVKTDAKDSLKLATLLQAGQLKRIKDLTDEEYHDRELYRCRGRAVQARSDICRQIKSVLLAHGIAGPVELERSWSQKAVAALKAMRTGSATLDIVLGEEVARYEAATESVKRLDKLVRALGEKTKYEDVAKRLETIPGVGRLSAVGLATELQSMKRFSNAAALSAYLGLTPSEYSSGGKVRRGRITHQGNSRCRTILIEAVWRALPQDPELKARYDDIAYRRGKKRATVALARRMATSIYAMLRDGKDWEHSRVAFKKANKDRAGSAPVTST